MDNEKLIDKIRAAPSFVIYGAQAIAYGTYVALKALYNITPEYFVVSKQEGNPNEIDGVSVKSVDGCKLPIDMLFIVAVTKVLQDEICIILEAYNYSNIFILDEGAEFALMSTYFDSNDCFPILKENVEGYSSKSLEVYIATHDKDKPLTETRTIYDWETTLQVGAALTDKQLSTIKDNMGNNISDKNKQYAEMTAAYWVWKNVHTNYKGIVHYRRNFILDDGQISELLNANIDAILPLPYLCYSDVEYHLRRFVSDNVVEVLKETLEVMFPANYGEYLKILKRHYFYSCNLVIARNKVYDDYCTWLFSVLSHMESYAIKYSELKTTKALAYTAEFLTTIYFLYNADILKIRHSKRRIYT